MLKSKTKSNNSINERADMIGSLVLWIIHMLCDPVTLYSELLERITVSQPGGSLIRQKSPWTVITNFKIGH